MTFNEAKVCKHHLVTVVLDGILYNGRIHAVDERKQLVDVNFGPGDKGPYATFCPHDVLLGWTGKPYPTIKHDAKPMEDITVFTPNRDEELIKQLTETVRTMIDGLIATKLPIDETLDDRIAGKQYLIDTIETRAAMQETIRLCTFQINGLLSPVNGIWKQLFKEEA